MLVVQTYDELTKELSGYLIKEDDRDVIIKCDSRIHKVIPHTIQCECGKYEDLSDLRKK